MTENSNSTAVVEQSLFKVTDEQLELVQGYYKDKITEDELEAISKGTDDKNYKYRAEKAIKQMTKKDIEEARKNEVYMNRPATRNEVMNLLQSYPDTQQFRWLIGQIVILSNALTEKGIITEEDLKKAAENLSKPKTEPETPVNE